MEADTIKQAERIEKIKKRITPENEKTTRNQTTWQKSQRDKHMAVLLERYLEPFLKWTRELPQMDQRTRKLMAMQKALHHGNDIDSQYVLRKGGRGLTSIEDNVNASIQRLENYLKKRGGRLIKND